jgi:hypothetical protein
MLQRAEGWEQGRKTYLSRHWTVTRPQRATRIITAIRVPSTTEEQRPMKLERAQCQEMGLFRD